MKDFFDVLKEYVPLWLAFISLAFGYLAFLYTKIFKQTNDLAAKQAQLAEKQAEYLQNRIDTIDKATGIFERTVKHQETDINRLYKTNEKLVKERLDKEEELAKLKIELDNRLRQQGVTLENLALGQRPDYTNSEAKAIDELSQQMKDLVHQLKTLVPQEIQNDKIISDTQLTLAKAQMAKGNSGEAADNFEQYTSTTEASWEVYFSKAVNLANLREGRKSNQASVKAYNDTINVLPSEIDKNIKARVFGYRGAILKRLNRLDEAEGDLNIAIKYASNEYEIDDINYNLACVYALQGNKEKMLSSLYKIKSKINFQSIKYHLDDYFIKFKDDSDFSALLKNRLSTKTGG
jgi:tetratricopeptide (TPR) repeat protein